MLVNDITGQIVQAAVQVHRTLGGPGLLESVYEEALVWELNHRSFHVDRQLIVPITYRGHELSTPLRLDLLVNNLVIVEVKDVVMYNSIFEAQALTYLRLMNLQVALVINFGERFLKDGIHRVVNGLK